MNNHPLLLGIDMGTTSVKAILFDASGQTVAQASIRTPTHYPQPGWAYYDPAELWQTTVRAIRQVVDQVADPQRIVSAAVTSFAETGVALDQQGQPTGPAIAWFDNRTAPQAEWLGQTLGAERLFAITGIALQPIFGLCKLLWLREHTPEAFDRTRLWLNMADYIAYQLCGVPATDFSLASRTLWLDLARLRWSAEVIEQTQTPPNLLAPLQPSGTRLGPVLPAVAAATGLPTSVQVAVGGHDHVCAAMALGVTQPGTLLNSIGTAEAIFLPLARPLTDPLVGQQGYAQGAHVGGHYYVFGGLYTSGATIDWFREQMVGGADYATLIAEAAQVPAGSLGTFFLPHLRMANPPNLDQLARGAFIGLRTDVKRGALFRAILEGLCYEFRYSLEPLLAHTGLRQVDKTYVVGGGAYNELLLHIKANILNQPLTVVSVKEATALGAAILGGVGAGVYRNLADALAQVRYEQVEVLPTADVASFYARAFQEVYRPFYATLRPLHHAIGQLV